jgi:hypothetical protein
MAKDISHELKVTQSQIPVAIAGAKTFTTIDTAGFESTMFVFNIGDCDGSASAAFHFHAGNTTADVDVDDADLETNGLIGTTNTARTAQPYTLGVSDDNQIITVQYKGSKRYVVPIWAYSAGTIYLGCFAVQSFARHPPR